MHIIIIFDNIPFQRNTLNRRGYHTLNPITQIFISVQEEIIYENDFLLVLFNVCTLTINNPVLGDFQQKAINLYKSAWLWQQEIF